MKSIPFIDLAAQRSRLGSRLDAAIAKVLDHGAFVMGPEVNLLEEKIAEHCGVPNAIACSSGTDAILLALMALDVGPGDAVLVPSFSFVAPAEMVALLGATPVFLDALEQSFNLDPLSIALGVAEARSADLSPVGVIAVDLFGQASDCEAIEAAAEQFGLWLVCDSAQSFGAERRGRKVGTVGKITTTSFYPAKPLSCYGDGGALFTGDRELAARIRSMVVHGMGENRYDNVRIGINGRLDTIQAAILIEKLGIFEEELALRNEIAASYSARLAGSNTLATPVVENGATSTWAQYTLRLNGIDRDEFRASLQACGVPSAIHYPAPLHRQPAYRDYPVAGGELPVSERLSRAVVSLPMHPYIDPIVLDRIVGAVVSSAEACGSQAR
ncbi:MAG: DegT/DnrJ/EryC1/StrS aminotransferase family protein [Albidovulum sp.]|nr:DegT/DnrJ/EryC1/StrS aminotransferase family protein [Albidovulum sp.]MDE0533944.1 DegT/DnrJ/EryC1/StrS aminotransferase family protein [Albidovulum sp.]